MSWISCFCASVQISNKQPKEGMMYVAHGFKDFSPSFLDPIIVAEGYGREGKWQEQGQYMTSKSQFEHLISPI